jgi:four helix bundle protein
MKSEDNFIHTKTFDYAVRIVELARQLQEQNREYVLSQQILKSGTSIGANVRESRNAQSRPDFINKLNIALKEADETGYWLDLLYATRYMEKENYESYHNENKFIIAILTKIIKSAKDGEA